jgi:chromosome segregation ATPase
METEIHILLDIEAEKSRTISNLELQLHNSQSSERALEHKLAALTDNFLTLEEHIAVMKDRLGNADFRGEDLEQQLQRV